MRANKRRDKLSQFSLSLSLSLVHIRASTYFLIREIARAPSVTPLYSCLVYTPIGQEETECAACHALAVLSRSLSLSLSARDTLGSFYATFRALFSFIDISAAIFVMFFNFYGARVHCACFSFTVGCDFSSGIPFVMFQV